MALSDLWGRLTKMLGLGRARTARTFLSSYDAARPDGWNRIHWLSADSLDANSLNSREVRRRLSYRARYEVANNSYAKGIVATHVNYVVGRGPSLRMRTGSPSFNSMVEGLWQRWAKKIDLAGKLRLAVRCRIVDGESFALLIRNPANEPEAELDLQIVEAEQVASEDLKLFDENRVDGIIFDEYGNPQYYEVLPYHPGNTAAGLIRQKPRLVPADRVIHLFKCERAGQRRGISELTPALNTFAAARRYREAVLQAAENAASISLVLKTQGLPDDGPDEVQPLSTAQFQKGLIMALPLGYDVYQPKAEQPPAQYTEYQRSLLCDEARVLNMPYNIAAADSSGYSFSGGKLDHLTYFVSIDVEQAELEQQFLEPLFRRWWELAVIHYGIVQADPERPPAHGWDWPRKPVIDEQKVAVARQIELSLGVQSLSRIYAEQGLDWEDELPRLAADFGITPEAMQKLLLYRLFGATPIVKPSDSSNQGGNGKAEGRHGISTQL